jgi:hypothetical protein
MSDSIYTQGQIIEAWESYKTESWYRVQKDGKSYVRRHMPNMEREVITKCTMAKVCDLMEFPRYLELTHG